MKGTANIGVVDGGVYIAADSPDTILSSSNYILTHPDLQRVVLNNHSFDFFLNIWQPEGGYASHGSHVLGLIAANANSSPTPTGTSDPRGGVGVCWYCSASYARMNFTEVEVASSLTWLAQQGAQVINLSGGWDKHLYDENPASGTYPGGIPCPGLIFDSYSSPLCVAIGLLEAQDVILVAAAGNADFKKTQFPANDPYAIGVGGIDSLGNRWDDAFAPYLWPHDSFDFNNALADSRCPDHLIYGSLTVTFQECGSNYSDIEEMDFVAPARRVISTVPLSNVGKPPPYDDFYFNDRNFPLDPAGQALADDGYAYATGTSMSSPIVAGIIGLMRSVNPIPNRNALYNVLRATASNGGILYNGLNGKAGTAWGVPNADAAVARILGKVGGVTVKNRLTPMFVTYNIDSGQRLYSTRPQAILGANSGVYMGAGNAPAGTYWQTQIVPGDFGVGYVGGYNSFPTLNAGEPGPILDSMRPRTGFWVFTSDVAPGKGWALKPLYRMSFREGLCIGRRHIYPISQTEIDSYLSLVICPGNFQSNEARYKYDGIDGYILENCPDGYQCNNFNDPTQPQKLHRIYSTCDGSRSALILASQLASGNWPAYTGTCGIAQPAWTITDIGYAFPNVDSDGDTVPDGSERLYGMNPNSVDSDCDGISDGMEFPVFGVQNVGSDPKDGVCP